MATIVIPTQPPATRPMSVHWRRLRRLPWLPILLLAPVVISGILGSLIFPHDPTAIDLMAPRKVPAWMAGGHWTYILGTDQFGRDLLSRLMEGSRVALIVAISSVFLAALIGVTAGMVAGYYGGIVDNVIMRIADVVFAIPAILLIILIGGAVGGGFATVLISIVIVSWVLYARVVRGETLVLRERGFVALAKVANCSDTRILVRHILPNLMPTMHRADDVAGGFRAADRGGDHLHRPRHSAAGDDLGPADLRGPALHDDGVVDPDFRRRRHHHHGARHQSPGRLAARQIRSAPGAKVTTACRAISSPACASPSSPFSASR